MDYVLDPSDPGTVSLKVDRWGGTGAMRIAGPAHTQNETAIDDAVAALPVLGEIADSGDDLSKDLEAAITDDVDVSTVRSLGTVGPADYWIGLSEGGEIALIASGLDGVTAVARASVEQFATEGLSLAISSPDGYTEPVYLLPEETAIDGAGLEEVQENLYREHALTSKRAATTIELPTGVSLTRLSAFSDEE
ncbi:hypothetical protein [Microbacterium sp. cx-59]|uniref:hypothetical protein n=1 Tax=Microbacterium sp. cx-59 TaxID=2891207 RepID=UPI001E5A565E|nr:hypothetical protein [Microbacterium sp. cx-59]MCC4908396.1 hypothetical protein [Microbacterium sp. cx-59]